jgi:hypothetical protein
MGVNQNLPVANLSRRFPGGHEMGIAWSAAHRVMNDPAAPVPEFSATLRPRYRDFRSAPASSGVSIGYFFFDCSAASGGE